ncbi:unnamed protein product [Trifolium pratense]|uniref:Uncharacterized protein n=1 Tax=Trifolium pratense TaxID=57577 RepID=A0ACB0IJ94_TRIPR|nr:unnamed protein product [Trifolium pratense]
MVLDSMIILKEKFSFNYDAGEYWALKILGKSWKRWKYDLRTKYLVSKKLKKELLENTPPEVDDVQWSKFIDHYQSDRMKETSEKNTVKRKKLQINHTGGTKSNQRRAYEMEAELRRPVCRAEVIVTTWLRKDETYSTKYAENMAVSLYRFFTQL